MRRLAVLPVLLGALLVPAVAHAGRVAVLADGGRSARLVRAQLVGGLIDGNVDVLSESEYDAAARRLGIVGDGRVSPDGIRRIAAVAAVDAVLHAEIHRHRRHQVVRITFYDAMGDQQLDRTYRLYGGRLKRSDLARLVDFVARKVPAAPSAGGAMTASPPDTGGSSDTGRFGQMASGGSSGGSDTGDGSSARRRDDDARRQRQADQARQQAKADQRRRDDDARRQREAQARRDRAPDVGDADAAWRRTHRRHGDDGFGTGGWAGDDHGRRRSDDLAGATRRLPYISVIATGGGGSRSYHLKGQFTTVDYQTAGLYPVAGAVLDVFPFASAGPFVEGLGLEGSLDRGFLSSQFVDGNGQAQSLQTPVLRWFADLRYRVRVSPDSPWSTAVGLRVGYGATDFSADLANAVFTGVQQSGVRLGLEASQPLAPPYLSLSLVLAAQPFAQPGQAEATAYGPNASAGGFSLRVGLTGGTAAYHRGLVYGVWFDLVSMSDQFKGTGSRDSNASATERYLSVTGGLGYAF